LVALVLLRLAPPTNAADAPPLQGWGPCAWGSADCNVCVPDAVDAVNRLRDHGDIMGFHMNGAPDVTMSKHWQGVQRLMGGGGRFLAVSRSLPDEDTDVGFVIVEMGSRNDEGVRFRSNKLDPDRFFEFTPPPLEDGVAAIVPHEPGFTHAGGMQALGNVLAVPFEDGGTSKVVFYDVGDPRHPVRLANDVDHVVDGGSSEAGTATLGKLADGRFLLIIGRADANILDFYVSTGTDLRTTGYERFTTWDEDDVVSELCGPFGCMCGLLGTDCEFGNYQNVNLVQQCDGTLYLAGTHASSVLGAGADFVDLYRLENGTGNAVLITKVAKRHLFCSYRGFTHCEGDAAGGLYVDPAGQLLVYLTEHDNDGPIEGFVPPPPLLECAGPACSVKLQEFRPIPHGTCTRIQDAWVELYDDAGFGDRSLMIDFVDRNRENYSNYDHVEDFEDRTSSVRWCLPPGATYRLWQDKEPCSGTHLDLAGSGALDEISDVGSLEPSCSQWLGGPFADAGLNRTAECVSPTTTPVMLDGSGSSGVETGPPLFLWEAPGVVFDDPTSATPTGAFPKGTTLVTLTVSDTGASNSDTVNVRVVDTTAPLLTCPADLTAECSTQGGAGADDPAVDAFLTSATVTDACDAAVEVTSDAPAVLGLGSTLVTFTATDDDLNTATCQATVTVEDTTAPAIDPSFAIAPAVLTPPNHRLVGMSVSDVVANEVCDPEPVIQCAVESSEPVNGHADGNTRFDIVFEGERIRTQGSGPRTIDASGGVGRFTLELRAERSGSGSGRLYTASCVGMDASGNAGDPESEIVTVPHGANGP
jgi:hypothetical protein